MTPVSKETAANVLFFFGEGGSPAGSFMQKLMSAISNADESNLDRLALGFPDLVQGMRIAMQVPNGIDLLKQIAGVVS